MFDAAKLWMIVSQVSIAEQLSLIYIAFLKQVKPKMLYKIRIEKINKRLKQLANSSNIKAIKGKTE